MDRIVEYYFNAEVLALAFPQVLAGFRTTVIVSLLVIACGTLFGLALALLRAASIRVVNFFITIYVDIFRTLPQLVVIIFIYVIVVLVIDDRQTGLSRPPAGDIKHPLRQIHPCHRITARHEQA